LNTLPVLTLNTTLTKILMLQENDGVVWPFMEEEDTL
jgi:hypothetical protein